MHLSVARSRWISHTAIFLLLLVILPTTVGAMAYLPMPHGTIGLFTEWKPSTTQALSLRVTGVRTSFPAAKAGVEAGDTIVSFPSFSDRIAIVGESNIYFLKPGQQVSFSIERAGRIIPIHLRAVGVPLQRTIWLYELRLALYLLGTLIVCALVLLRPSVLTWGFALFVILATPPTLEFTEFIGSLGWPPGFLAAWFLTDAMYYIGLQGLVAFAVRFPDNAPRTSYRMVERVVLAYNAVLLVGLAFSFSTGIFGAPTWSLWNLNYFLTLGLYNVAALVAIALLAVSLYRAAGDAKIPLYWALGGPLLSMTLYLADAWLSSLPSATLLIPLLLGMFSSIAPFAMMYAILRHKVLDIGFTLNTTFVEAISQATGPTEPAIARRQIVRRTALLLSADLPLQTLYSQFAILLASFVDASTVLLAVKSAKGSHFEFIFEDGVSGKPDDTTVTSHSNTGRVLRDGKSLLYRNATEWPSQRFLSLGGQTSHQTQSAIFVPIVFGGSIVGALSVQSTAVNAYNEEDLELIETSAVYLGARIHDEDQHAQRAELRALATHDALTGLGNRRAFDEAIATQCRRTLAIEETFNLLMIDIDYFKPFNDAYGHVAGDACLRQISHALQSSLSHNEGLVTRFGGEEFAVILNTGDMQHAIHIAEAFCAAVRALAIPHQGSSLGYVTISIGVGSLTDDAGCDPRMLILNADACLYEAKDAGRNRVVARGYRAPSPTALPRFIERNNLPVPQTSFIGRQAAIEEIESAMNAHQLVTIVGAGGAGKTRTALEVARRSIGRFPDGVWFVDLCTVLRGDAVAQAVANAVLPRSERIVNSERLVELLRENRLLIVLDNCEHVIDACARLIAAILVRAPGVAVLATSRENLAISGERVYRLPALSEQDGISLLLERARSAGIVMIPSQNLAVAERIVGALDGLPMAIELAAARLVMLSPDELLLRLTDRLEALRSTSREIPQRQQTLGALLDWSYNLLPENERTIFTRLAIFDGSWTLATAALVCGDHEFALDAVEGALSALVRKSLVVVNEQSTKRRFHFLDTTADYAQALLKESVAFDAVASRHAECFAALARERIGQKRSLHYVDWLRLQRDDLENYHAALRHALSTGCYNLAVDIVRSLGGLMLFSQSFEDISLQLRKVIRDTTLSKETQGWLLLGFAELAQTKNPGDALEASRRAYDLFTQCNDGTSAAYALWMLASTQLRVDGGIDEALHGPLQSCLMTVRKYGDRHLSVGLLRHIAYIRSEVGRFSDARAALREAAEIIDRTDVGVLAALLGSSAREEFRSGNFSEAVTLWRRASALVEESLSPYASLCRLNAGLGALMLGDTESASILLREGFASLEKTGHIFGIALAFDYFALLAHKQRDPVRAAQLAGFAARSFEAGPRRDSLGQAMFDELIDQLRKELGLDAFEREWSRGRMLDLSEASPLVSKA